MLLSSPQYCFFEFDTDWGEDAVNISELEQDFSLCDDVRGFIRITWTILMFSVFLESETSDKWFFNTNASSSWEDRQLMRFPGKENQRDSIRILSSPLGFTTRVSDAMAILCGFCIRTYRDQFSPLGHSFSYFASLKVLHLLSFIWCISTLKFGETVKMLKPLEKYIILCFFNSFSIIFIKWCQIIETTN